MGILAHCSRNLLAVSLSHATDGANVDGIGVMVSDRADRKRHNNFLVSLRQLCHLAGDFRRMSEGIRVALPRQSRNSASCPICNLATRHRGGGVAATPANLPIRLKAWVAMHRTSATGAAHAAKPRERF